MSTRKSPKEIVTGLLQEVWSEGNVEASEKYIASRYTVRHDPGDPWQGKELDLEGYKQRVRVSRGPFPDQHFEIQDLIAEGNTVVVTWLWSGTHKGDIPGFPASGKRITMSGATVYYFEGSKITAHWQIADRLSVYQQLRQPTAP